MRLASQITRSLYVVHRKYEKGFFRDLLQPSYPLDREVDQPLRRFGRGGGV